jgi:hypothetical protein
MFIIFLAIALIGILLSLNAVYQAGYKAGERDAVRDFERAHPKIVQALEELGPF